MENPFSWDYLTTAPGASDTFDPFSVTYLIVFVLGLVGSMILYNRPTMLSARRLLRRQHVRFWASVFMWIFGLGLFFFVVRWLQINPFGFGERLWLYLSLLAAIIAAALFLWQMRVTAPLLATEATHAQIAHSRGIAGRRPPKRSRRRKR